MASWYDYAGKIKSMLKHKKTLYKTKNVAERYKIAQRYFKFLGERTKKQIFKERKKWFSNYDLKLYS